MFNKPIASTSFLCFWAMSIVSQGLGQDQLYDNEATVETAYWNDTSSANQFLADDFSLDSDSRVNGLQWRGVYGNFVSDDSFNVDFYVDDEGLPFESPLVTIPLVVNRTGTGETVVIDGFTFPVFEYSATFEDLVFDGGTDYWLSIENQTNGALWSWGAELDNGSFAFRFDEEEGWDTFPGTLDFRVIGTAIPEPSVFSIVFAIALLAGSNRRRF